MPSIQFKGKTFVQNHHLAVPYHELIPHAKKSKTDTVSLRDNLVVHGDNLVALKALLPTYAGGIKVAYIDPPYNTGTEGWVYNDKVNAPLIANWIGEVVGKEGEDLTRHDKWLCMMTPRLKLIKELLSDDGVLLVSINDIEMASLQLILGEVFGNSNHLATFIWNYEGNIDNQSAIKTNHEYVLAWAKDKSKVARPTVIDPNVEEDSKLYNDEIGNTITKNGPKNPPSQIELPAGFPANFDSGEFVPQNEQFPHVIKGAKVKNGVLTQPLVLESGWSSANLLKLFIANDFEEVTDTAGKETWFKLHESGAIYVYKRRSDAQHHVLSVLRNLGTTNQASRFLKSIGIDFDYPKPTGLIKYLISVFSTESEDVVLDSFAGSGPTAQAVLELNKEDGGHRKFILVEMEDYADQITAERVRKLIGGIPDAKPELREGFDETFSFFELGDAIEPESLLSGKKMPSYESLARYIYFTSTGEEFDASKLDESKQFVGRSSQFDIYMYYKPDPEYLKSTALTLDEATALRKRAKDRPLLVFAPTKYVDQTELDNLKITFCQLPFEIYKVKASGTS